MAEEDSGSAQPPPARQQQQFTEVKTEPASPSRHEDSHPGNRDSYPGSRDNHPGNRDYQPDSRDSHPGNRDTYPGRRNNGMTNGGINGEYAGSEDSMDCDAPLDFSMKKSSSKNSGQQQQDSQHDRRYIKREDESSRDYMSEGGESRSPGSSVKAERVSGLSPRERDGPTAPVTGAKPEQLIGEPQTALPGMLPGTTIPTLPGAGLIPGMMPPGFPFINPALLGTMPGLGAAGIPEMPPTSTGGRGGKGGKPTRPFKAYPKDPLSLPIGYYGLPGMLPGMEGIDPAVLAAGAGGSEELFKNYLKQVQDQMRLPGGNGLPANPPPLPNVGSRQPPPPQAVSTSPTSSTASPKHSSSHSPGAEMSTPPRSTASSSPGAQTPSQPGGNGSRKRPRTLPDDMKDEAYWERRRKNNEAAKRSRDSRRAKEDEIAIRAAFLEQENLKLRVEVAALKNETAKLRCMLYNS